jgi:hypothetical protein
MARVVVGVFHNWPAAEHALVGLKAEGFDPTRIGFMMRTTQEARQVTSEAGADVGAAPGGMLGGALGAILADTGSVVIPGVGPFIAAGILETAITGGAAGAVIGGLVGLGVPHEEAGYYNRRVQEGAALVTVDAQGRESETQQILLRNGAEDTWSTTPWRSLATSAPAQTMRPEVAPLHRTAPITGGPGEPTARIAVEQPERTVERGSVVGPEDAIQHGPATNPFAGELQVSRPVEGPINYDEPTLGEPTPLAPPNALPPEPALP